MKKLWNALVLALAANFLLAAGGVAWLYRTGRLDRDRVTAIRKIVLDTPDTPAPTDPAAQASGATTRPSMSLEALLDKHTGKRAGEQVEVVQQAFDAQSVLLDRRRREVEDLAAQVAREQEKLAEDRAALEAQRRGLSDREAAARGVAGDKGFQDSLKLYTAMPARQVKGVFLSMPDETVVRYLRALPPRTATKIVKEFKTPQETEQIRRIMERMRQGEPATQPAGTNVEAPGPLVPSPGVPGEGVAL
jgi:hypothetical protein